MNIRTSNGAIRFRITNTELVELLAENILQLSHITKNYYVRMGKMDAPLFLDLDANKAVLIVDKTMLEDFSKQLPSKEGIEYQQDGLLLALEVDVRKNKS
jgi:hypothetical protein